MYQRYCALPPYPVIIYGRFDPFKWAADPNQRSDFYDARQVSAATEPAKIKGFANAVGCGNATMLLKTGDRVRVDGGRGIVEILSWQIRSEE